MPRDSSAAPSLEGIGSRLIKGAVALLFRCLWNYLSSGQKAGLPPGWTEALGNHVTMAGSGEGWKGQSSVVTELCHTLGPKGHGCGNFREKVSQVNSASRASTAWAAGGVRQAPARPRLCPEQWERLHFSPKPHRGAAWTVKAAEHQQRQGGSLCGHR